MALKGIQNKDLEATEGITTEEQGLQDVIIEDPVLTQHNEIDQSGYGLGHVFGNSFVWWGIDEYEEAFVVNIRDAVTGDQYGAVKSTFDHALIASGDLAAAPEKRVYKIEVNRDGVYVITNKWRFDLRDMASGPGYVWTDVLGDGMMTMQPPAAPADTVQTLVEAAVTYFDVNLGKSAMLTLTDTRTLQIVNFVNGQTISLLVMQDGTGGHELILQPMRLINGGNGGVAPLTLDPLAHDILTFWKINDTIYCNYGKNYKI